MVSRAQALYISHKTITDQAKLLVAALPPGLSTLQDLQAASRKQGLKGAEVGRAAARVAVYRL